MTALDGVGFSGLGELFQRIGARGLEHPVTRAGVVRIGDDQRACDELREQIDHGEFVDRLVGRDRLRRPPSVKPPAKTASRRNTTRSCSESSP